MGIQLVLIVSYMEYYLARALLATKKAFFPYFVATTKYGPRRTGAKKQENILLARFLLPAYRQAGNKTIP